MRLHALLTAGLLLPPSLPASPSPRDAAGAWPRWRGPHDNGSTEIGAYPVRWDAASGAGVRWKIPLPGKGCSTPVVWNGRIMLTSPVEGQDSLLAFDWAGQLIWQTQLGPERAGKHRNGSGSNPSAATDGTRVFASSYYASPAAADGKLYAAREDGVIFVAKVADGFELLSENPMGERVIASPVPVANRLLIRGEQHLFSVGP